VVRKCIRRVRQVIVESDAVGDVRYRGFVVRVGALSRRLAGSLDAARQFVTSRLPQGTAGARTVGLIAVLCWVAFMSFISLARYGGDFRALLCLGQRHYHPASLDGIPRAGPAGYDGQYYVTLATDPFFRQLDTAKAIDAPAYRAERILIPLLAWLLAAGNAGGAIIAYQLLCWALGLGAVYLAARLLVEEGRSPWLALLLVPTAGLVASMIRSTLDATAVFFILATLWAYVRRQDTLALALATCAVLTREMSYLVAVAVAFDQLRHRRFVRSAAFVAVPLAPYMLWQLYLRSVLGPRYLLAHGGFTIPFSWVGEKLPHVFRSSGVSWMELFGLAAVAATTVAFILLLAQPKGWTPTAVAYLAFAGLGLALTYDIYVETWGYARILVVVPFLATVVGGRQPTRSTRWSLRAITIFYLLAGLMMMRGELRSALHGRSVLAALRHGATIQETLAGGTAQGGPQAWQPHVSSRPLYVVPVANSAGRAGASWQTRLEVTNLGPVENRILIDLLPEGRDSSGVHRTIVTLHPNETRSWENVVYQLFGFSGAGALRLLPLAGPVSAASLTANVARGATMSPLLPALSRDQAIHTGERATLQGLAHDPSHSAAVRTNVGALNLSDRPIQVRIEPRDSAAHTLGEIQGELPASGFLQVDDIFGRVNAGIVERGSVVIDTVTPGAAFLAYASVIRGPDAPVVYDLPQASDRPPANDRGTVVRPPYS
jgi:hypothetical protein